MPSDWRVNFPVVGAVIGADGKLVLNPIVETIPVRENYAKLSQVPFQDTKQSTNVAIEGMVEIPTGEPLAGQYRVNYITGRVYFHVTADGTAVNAAYQGKGTLVAEDEINWLWENVNKTAENLYYVSLNDTPKILLPRGVQVADPTGTKIEQMSPEIGRSYSDTAILRDFNGTYRFSGSVFDWVTVWKLAIASTEEEVKDISSGYTDSLVLTDGVYRALGADGHFFSSEPVFVPGARKITGVSVPDATGEVALLVSMNGIYHSYKNGEWVKIGTLNAIRALPYADWNTLAEYKSIPQVALGYLNENTLNFAVFCRDGGAFQPKIALKTSTGFGYERVDFTAVFDKDTEEWEVKMPSGYDYAVITGSGKDDMSCTSEVVEFKNVLPGETVSVAAPVRTNINVLYKSGAQNFVEAFPSAETRQWVGLGWPDSLPPTVFKPPVATPALYSDMELYLALSKSGVTSVAGSIFCDATYSGLGNYLADGPEPYSASAYGYGAGAVGAAFVLGKDNKIGFVPQPVSNYTPATGTFTVPYTIGGIFRCLSGSATLFSPDVEAADQGPSIIITPNSVIHASTGAKIADLPSGFNFIALTGTYINVKYGGSPSHTNTYINSKLWVNGTAIPIVSGIVTYTHPLKFRSSCNIGGAYGAHNGKLLAAQCFYLPTVLSDTQAHSMYTELSGLGYEKKAAENKTYVFATTELLTDSLVGGNVAVEEPKGWEDTGAQVYYGFLRNDGVYTFDRDSLYVRSVPQNEPYSALAAYAADIATMQKVLAGTGSVALRGARLVCFSYAEPGTGAICAVPGNVVTTARIRMGDMRLASNTEMRVSYSGTEWQVRNNLAEVADIRVAVLGGGLADYTAPNALKFFTELLDTPNDLNDLAPKALVSHNGSVAKALRVHPYLLGGI